MKCLPLITEREREREKCVKIGSSNTNAIGVSDTAVVAPLELHDD
jgi:hypothetical protein